MLSIWRTLDRDSQRAIVLISVAYSLIGASFGAIAVSGGLPLWVPVVMSLFVFAGASQFVTVGVIFAGGGAVAAVLAGLVLNARLLPFGFAVAGSFGSRWWSRLIGAHTLTDASVGFVLRHQDPALRRAAFWAGNIAAFLVWNAATVLGALAGDVLGDTDALGLDVALPAILLSLVLPSLTGRGDGQRARRRAALVGGVLAVATTPLLPTGVPVLLALAALPLTLLRDTPPPKAPPGPRAPATPSASPAPPAPPAPETP
ncbi:AzlC family ABC transporter permease [Streptomyces xiamenensis]|uniref:AzlC family ABC transporter permease n=1 Tax=Streptomyces xiamenensis TaxID=408015 RepID=UPI00099C3680|nr:AzlC family ABC transporter permease [Streptomyces xiamenensis]